MYIVHLIISFVAIRKISADKRHIVQDIVNMVNRQAALNSSSQPHLSMDTTDELTVSSARQLAVAWLAWRSHASSTEYEHALFQQLNNQ